MKIVAGHCDADSNGSSCLELRLTSLHDGVALNKFTVMTAVECIFYCSLEGHGEKDSMIDNIVPTHSALHDLRRASSRHAGVFSPRADVLPVTVGGGGVTEMSLLEEQTADCRPLDTKFSPAQPSLQLGKTLMIT